MFYHIFFSQKLVDPTSGNDISTPGKEGEIWVKGPQVMKGYIGQSESTADVITKDGWFKTGKQAVLV